MIFARRPKSLESLATHQANLKVQWPIYFRCFPWLKQRLIMPVVMCIASLAAQLWAFAALWVLLLLPHFQRFRWIKRHFERGDVNAAKIVGTAPYLIAAFADLSTTGDYFYPAIRIIEQPLDRVSGHPFETGYNMPAVSLYYGVPSGYKWDNFNPIVAQCATTDQQEIRRLMDMIPEWQWLLLNEGLFQVPRPFRPGLYPIALQTDPED